MRGAQLPPNFLFYMFAVIAIGPGLWMLLLMWAFGDAKYIPWKRIGQVIFVCFALAGFGHSQQPGWAQDRFREQDSALREQDARINRLSQEFEVHKNVEEITRSQINRDIARVNDQTDTNEKDINALKGTEQRLYGISLALGALGSAFIFGFVELVKAYRTKNGKNGNGGH